MSRTSPILVVGEGLVDLVHTERGFLPVPGGSPFNTARAIARLGLRCSWAGGLSDDRLGRQIETALRDDAVELDCVARTQLPTGLALADVDAAGIATYRFYLERTASVALDVSAPLLETARDAPALLVGSLGLVLEPIASTVRATVAAVGPEALLMIDPNVRLSAVPDPAHWAAALAWLLPRADIVKASSEDLAVLHPGMRLADAARRIRAHGPSLVVVTDGPRPILVCSAAGESTVEAPRVEVADTIGAGDTFSAGLLASLVRAGVDRDRLRRGDAVGVAVSFALRASAAVCERVGADPPTIEELGGWPMDPMATPAG